MPQSQMSGIIRFGIFELEPQTGILRKHGVRVRLQDQPFQVLLALLENRGEVVTREELHQKVWAGAIFGDFDHSLNIAVNKIREALGDSAETPRFVETLPRRGYRFIAPVEGGVAPAPPPPVMAPRTVRVPRWLWATSAAAAVVALITVVLIWMLPPAPPQLEWRRLTNDSSVKFGPVLSDGARLYFRTGNWAAGSDLQILQVPVSGGTPERLPVVPPPGYSYSLLDITPDGQEVLLAAFESQTVDLTLGARFPELAVKYWEADPLWTLRFTDGSSRRIGTLRAREARYSPDGKQLAFTSGKIRSPGSLWVASSDGSNVRQLFQAENSELDIVAPCWSADGSRILFGQNHRPTNQRSTWEIGVDGAGLRRVLTGFQRSHLPGGWLSDGGLLLISEGQFWVVQARRPFQFRQPAPIQLTTADPQFAVPIQVQQGRQFYSVGTTRLAELQRCDKRSARWEPYVGGISADGVEYSRDGQSFLYITHPERELWVRRADGSHPVQLTKSPMEVSLGRWSPDGQTIAFAGRNVRERPLRLYLVDAAGGSPFPACPKEFRLADLAWMPDGKKIIFDEPFKVSTSWSTDLGVLDLATGALTRFPGSDGLSSPRLSPDGDALVALVRGGLALYRFSEGTWKRLPQPGPGGPNWPCWSRDGRSVWYCNLQREQIIRVHLSDNRQEVVAPLKVAEMTGYIGSWFSITPDDEPMILRRRDVQQIYALDLKPR